MDNVDEALGVVVDNVDGKLDNEVFRKNARLFFSYRDKNNSDRIFKLIKELY